MISIKALEYQTASLFRSGLSRVMRNADPRDVGKTIAHAGDRLTGVLYEPLYQQILKIYSTGYVAGGDLIARHAPRGTMKVAAVTPPIEDPRIAKATKNVIYGLKDSLNNHKNEIQATMRAGFERGKSIPKLSSRLSHYFDNNRTASTRMARTVTNDVYNRAHLDRYEDSGMVDGVQYSAYLNERTSDICRMLNGTIWRLGDRGIIVPPSHFNCRSRLVPWFGGIPSKRDFKMEFGTEMVGKAKSDIKTFRSEYWTPMPHTKASATWQRSYFQKSNIKTINKGLTLAIKEERTTKTVPTIIPLERLKSMLRYRRIDPDKSIIIDRFGKSVLLDKFEERNIVRAIRLLISQTEGKITRETAKRIKAIDLAWKDVIATRKGISKREKDILYYKKRMKADPANTLSYQKFIEQDKKLITLERTQEAKQIETWNRYVDMEPSAIIESLESEKERYQYLLGSFKFQKR